MNNHLNEWSWSMRSFLIYRRTHNRYCIALSAVVCLALFSAPVGAGVEEFARGDQALGAKDLKKAEVYYTEALSAEPENHRVKYYLARVKAELGKPSEAIALADQILKLPVSNGRDVMVFFKGESAGLAAELVDQTVLASQDGKNNMRNYLDSKSNEPIPQYRLFFKKEGKMKLVPQSAVSLKYTGVLRLLHEETRTLRDRLAIGLMRAPTGAGSTNPMVAIPGGCFMMGSDQGAHAERPVHEVCISSFKMNKYEVVQANFKAAMGSNPAQYVEGELPVDSITWYEAETYCKKSGYRLPTEAEWEYAVRSGSTTQFYWGNTVRGKEGNFCDKNCDLNVRVASVDDGFAVTAPVGKFPANAFGLHDMAGNLAEWTADWLDENYYRTSPRKDPTGPHPTRAKVVRGGAWNTSAGFLRSANRAAYEAEFRNPGLGFRCASDS